jgi:glycosyltransferase involved in cell wall biosynthesis
VEKLAAGLAGRGVQVDVATTGSEPASDEERSSNPAIRRFATLRNDEVFFLSPLLALWLLRSAGKYDVVHVHSYHTPVALLGAVAAWLHRVPFVVTPHYHGTGHTKARQRLHRPYRRAGTWMVRHAALVLCNSEAERTLVTRDFGSDLATRVVLPGIDDAVASTGEPAPSTANKVVLAGGRLEQYKQVDRVVEAIAHLPASFRLVVFGEGPDLDRIVGTTAACGVANRVDIAGRMPDDALKGAFRTAAVFVSLSRQEAFGLTVLEAAAVGTPVVCSDIPAYREVSGLLPPGAITLLDVDVGPAAVATAIAAAAAGPRPVAPSVSQLPTWSTMAAGILDGYAAVLESRGRSFAAPGARAPVARRIHVTGGSGSGKTTIAARLGALSGLPVFHLDEIARDPGTGLIRSEAERLAMVAAIAAQPSWVTEGIHVAWTDELLRRADTILWLDHVRAGRAVMRVARRFAGGGVAESRRSHGLRRFFRPASYLRHLRALGGAIREIRAYDQTPPGVAVGDAGSRAATAAQLAPHASKVVHCTRQADVDAFLADAARRVAAESDRAGA